MVLVTRTVGGGREKNWNLSKHIYVASVGHEISLRHMRCGRSSKESSSWRNSQFLLVTLLTIAGNFRLIATLAVRGGAIAIVARHLHVGRDQLHGRARLRVVNELYGNMGGIEGICWMYE